MEFNVFNISNEIKYIIDILNEMQCIQYTKWTLIYSLDWIKSNVFTAGGGI